MRRIKLPGSDRIKKIILGFLVVTSIIIIGYEGKANKENNKQNENTIEQQIIKPMEDNAEPILEDDEQIEKNENEQNKLKNDISQREKELYNQAYTEFFSNKYNESIDTSSKLIEEFPETKLGYNIRGIAKAYNGDYESGMSDIDVALKIDPHYGYARFNKALTYELYDQLDLALEWYNKALDIEDYKWSYYGISSIYGRRGDVNNTVEYLKKAIIMDKSIKEVAKTEHDFEPVRDSKEFQDIIYN